jgi:SAM-dependent methyltransferase
MPQASDDWYDDDSFWTVMFPFMFTDDGFARAREEAGSVTQLAGVERGAVLDLCCGPGRFAVPLAQLGYQVTGVDRTRFLLDRAREYAERENAVVEWVESDMRSYSRAAAFDLVLNMFTSFGYFDDPEENRLVLQNVYDSLRSGGVFVLESMGKEILARIFEATGSTEIEGVGLCVQRRRVIDEWSRMENEWWLIRDGVASTYGLRHWIYSARELREMLEAVGFGTVAIYGDVSGAPYDQRATRLVAVAEKTT